MANTCEPLINVVRSNKPKGLRGLDQKGMWPGGGAPVSPPADVAPPADRRSLPHPRVLVWNVGNPYPSLWESEPQGEPIGVRAWDAGGSERHPVMGWRGVEPCGNITPRASGLTSHAGLASRETLANRL